MVFNNLKIYLAQRSIESAIKKEEKVQIKLEHKRVKNQLKIDTCTIEEVRRWGPKILGQAEVHDYDDEEHMGECTRAVVHRYQRILGITHLMNPLTNKKYFSQLKAGYFEPIPLLWQNAALNPLTTPIYNSNYDDAAEERLYWVLNHHIHLDSKGNRLPSVGPKMKPDEFSEMRMANARMRTAIAIDQSHYESEGDYFKQSKVYSKQGYSRQVPAVQVSPAFTELFRNQALEKAQGGQGHHNDEVDVMLLLDVSSSMGWDHYYPFSQPRHIEVVHNILKRSIPLMEVRDSYSESGGAGVETVCFNTYGYKLGKLNSNNFEDKWKKISSLVYSGGGTRIMVGWQKIKNLHFEKHGGPGKSYYDPTFGHQATKKMAKLSLLIMLDGEALDMDELELEILGEKWCYVTIVLIDGCLDHHRHANELTRIAAVNDHVCFYDIVGRLAERLVVSDVLKRVYATSAPTYEEIMDTRLDLPGYSVTANNTTGDASGSRNGKGK